MKIRRGRSVALLIGVLAVAILVMGILACKGLLVEQYYLRRLESDDVDERMIAAEKLVDMKSVRAIPPLLTHAGKASGQLPLRACYFRVGSDTWMPYDEYWRNSRSVQPSPASSGGIISVSLYVDSASYFEMLLRITATTPQESVRHLVKAMRNGDPYVRYLAAVLLRGTGSHARFAVHPLSNLLRTPPRQQDWENAARRQVVLALSGIGREARAAIPALTACHANSNEDRVLRSLAADALTRIRGAD